LLHALEPHLQPGTIVTDAGSTKSDVIMAAKTALGDKVAQFVPAHPIAGRELNGVEAALDDLYVGKKVVLCPLQENSRADVAAVRAMWEATGADCHVMSAVQHDAVFASVSHLPHLLSYALVAQVANAEDAALKLDFAGGGFRDFTRIAASSPEMWRDICIANKDALLREISIYESVLAHLKTKIKEGDGAALERLFARASDTPEMGRRTCGRQQRRTLMPPARGAQRPCCKNMEQLTLGPLTRASGTVRLPGSKSISNRVLLLSALATGETRPRPARFRRHACHARSAQGARRGMAARGQRLHRVRRGRKFPEQGGRPVHG
jgi:prephenate dehydrogenase